MKSKLKTLLIEYSPRGVKSRTKRLRKYLTDLIEDYTNMEIWNVCKNPPPLMDYDSVQAYYKRNYEGKSLSTEEQKKLEVFDKMRDQLMNTDILILSTPMYYFGTPAPMKAWIDGSLQRGYAYKVDEDGHVPLLKNLKVLLIYTSGIVYDQLNENEDWNGLTAEGARLFEYMGAKIVRTVNVQGIDMLRPENVKFRTENVAKKKLNDIAMDWYKVEQELERYNF